MTGIPLEDRPDRSPTVRVAAQRRFGGYLLEASALMRSGFLRLGGTPGPSRRFVIFGRGRSGSTLLVSMLDGHDQISCDGEIMRFRTMFPAAYLKNCLKNGYSPVSGCKLLSYQMRTIHRMPPTTSFLRDLAADGVSIIYLRRENLIRHAISNIYARKRGIYHSSQRQADLHRKVSITLPEIETWIEGSQALGQYEAAVLTDVAHLSLTYEADLMHGEAREQTYRTLLQHFGLPWQAPKTALRKVTPENYSAIVENYAALIEGLANGPYRSFLTAPDLERV